MVIFLKRQRSSARNWPDHVVWPNPSISGVNAILDTRDMYAVKTSEKANMHNHTGLTTTLSARSVYLGAQEVTTNGMYGLPYAIYYCS